ncbi:MAG: RsmE family RNA methyltransferase, partial [Deltaproteobacteria bacterium]|nr:RsmE family RNA methyltransferase [Deltaproteobacteria bacterium]
GIVPFMSRYTVVKIKDDNFIKRSKKIILEAVGQSMRQHIPELYNPTTYQELITSMPMVQKILFHYGPGIPPLHDFTGLLKQPERIMLIIGPEGGFSGDELQYANDHKVIVAGLGNNVLRAETAAIAAISIASFVR